MSWGIKLFAEKKRKGSDTWEMIGNTCIMQEVRYMLITPGVRNEFTDVDIDEAFDDVDNSELSKGVLDYYEGKIDNYHIVKTYSSNDMWELTEEFIKKFQQTFLMCYKALGIKCEESEYKRVLDTYDENTAKYTSSGAVSESYSPLTYPINKELLVQLNVESGLYYKAIWWRGVLASIKNLADEDYEKDKDAEIRLVFVRSC